MDHATDRGVGKSSVWAKIAESALLPRARSCTIENLCVIEKTLALHANAAVHPG
jgi:hypothetical protein